MRSKLIRSLSLAWAGPNTVLGLCFGVLALLTGGGLQCHRGCVEFHGGFVLWALRRMIGGRGAAAMTLGHCILGQSPQALRIARDHEHVHVQQYERWGPFFLPMYLAWSALRWLQGRDAYLDNPFEVDAYRISTPVFTEEDLNRSDDEP